MVDKQYKSMVEIEIENIVSKTDFKNANFDVTEIKEQIKQLTGAIPSIQIGWKTLKPTNEDLVKDPKAKGKDLVEGLTITWLDSENNMHQLKYLV